jgi:hypothetical protein
VLSSFVRIFRKIAETAPPFRRSKKEREGTAARSPESSRTAARRKAVLVPRKSKVSAKKDIAWLSERIEGEPLEPIRVVERELIHPDGTALKVEVPVYPPFELKQRHPAKTPRSRKVRKAS